VILIVLVWVFYQLGCLPIYLFNRKQARILRILHSSRLSE